MVFRVNPSLGTPAYDKVLRARMKISMYPFNQAEVEMDAVIREEYGVGLRTACLLLYADCRVSKNTDNELIVTFPRKEDDELASLITYGRQGLKGSAILRYAFGRD